MSRKRTSSAPDIVRRDLLLRVARYFLVASLFFQIAGCLAFWSVWRTGRLDRSGPQARMVFAESRTPTPPLPPPAPTSTPTPVPTPTPAVPRVGLIAGHWQNDSGAICEDTGLQEVEVTVDVAERTVELLRERGYWVDMLPEFAPELYGYRADALLSVHVDSCVNWEGTTGFKAARAFDSTIPQVEDQFVACIYKEYAKATGLPIHSGSVTHNMRKYHAFYKIDPLTPAVIIEIGFLYHDRDVLTQRTDDVAKGLANSIECFLETQGKKLP